MTDQIHRILTRVQKPARYVGGEYNQIVKRKQDIDVRVAFCFPDTYEIGMSNTTSFRGWMTVHRISKLRSRCCRRRQKTVSTR